MEFFTECTDSLSLIYKWIDNSDIFLLLFGGRYGTIEENSQLGFVELEYRYALKNNKPIIVLKLSDKYIRNENKPKENCNSALYEKFISSIEGFLKVIDEKNELCKGMTNWINSAINEHSHNVKGWVKDSFIRFNNTDEVDDYVAKRLKEAKSIVYDFTWADNYDLSRVRNEAQRVNRQLNFNSAISNIQDGVDYREIFTFPKNRTERYYKVEKLINHFKEDKRANYYCGYYKTSIGIFPKLHIIIIDNEEVIFDSSLYGEFNCANTNKNIVEIMLAYAKEAWTLSHKINDLYMPNKNVDDNLKKAQDECKTNNSDWEV